MLFDATLGANVLIHFNVVTLRGPDKKKKNKNLCAQATNLCTLTTYLCAPMTIWCAQNSVGVHLKQH